MSTLALLISIVAIWVTLVALVSWLLSVAAGLDPVTRLLWHVVHLHARLWHGVRFVGREYQPRGEGHGGLIVVSNHTGAIDPLLIQAGCRFVIRWMMASDMMGPGLDWLWERQQIISVGRDGRDSGPLREAIRHVKAGGAVGIFPEGRIVSPPRQVWPFIPGVGLIVAKTKAPVLLVWVSGTPDTNKMFQSLLKPSRSRVEFVDLIDFGDERDATKITEALRTRIHAASGWPLEDNPAPPQAVLQNG